MDISLEIVPRSEEALKEGALRCASYSEITCINVPDLSRFSIRSWEACSLMRETLSSLGETSRAAAGRAFIPHLRARNFYPHEPFPLKGLFRELGITKTLVITGDPLQGEAEPLLQHPFASSPAISFIKKLKAEMPELEIFAAFDPYRTNIRFELDYLAAKEEAGAAGFMSQPFFDIRLLEIYAEYLEGKRVFWGIAPVTTAGNRNYWESRNRAIFPKSFRADLSWNINFAGEVLDFCKQYHFNLYLMPIKMDIQTYLAELFARKL